MPRIRTIKPDFWSDRRMVKMSPLARLFYVGMWNFALCDNGHLPDDAEELKLKILPADDVDPDDLLKELMDQDRVRRHQAADGSTYLWARKLRDHQKVDARWQPRCPYCKESHQSTMEVNGWNGSAPTPETLSNPAETPASSGETQRATPELPETPRGKESKGREGSSGTGSTAANGRNARTREAAPNREPPNNDPPGPIERALAFLRSLIPDGRIQPAVQDAIAEHVAAAYTVATPEAVVHEAIRVWVSRQGNGRCGPRILPLIIQDLTGNGGGDQQTSSDLVASNVVAFPGRQRHDDTNSRSAFDCRPEEWLARAAEYESREAR